ncbi:hypothetical protein [Rhizobium laguerreae]|uniref:Uncharacterized protein n=1 Tax=Rhizobium laguerreae TaxID=1076926 RepID=A0A6N9Z8L2_9HYPH|nr:hypothetical protein [Rhizobium laguerreae]NEH89812.1 hypothetical protein [Rhizobium laguerreae]
MVWRERQGLNLVDRIGKNNHAGTTCVPVMCKAPDHLELEIGELAGCGTSAENGFAALQ